MELLVLRRSLATETEQTDSGVHEVGGRDYEEVVQVVENTHLASIDASLACLLGRRTFLGRT